MSFVDFVWRVGERPWITCAFSRLHVTNAPCLAEETKETSV
ncbi:hypothetical protein HMPREF9061_01084 [Actinomyces sp. oral taxon 181 str. F0379]|nr:hypothetical protein HMPREF9061_01084 [Actinomyces sp. oral taxon 181 str. F0379]